MFVTNNVEIFQPGSLALESEGLGFELQELKTPGLPGLAGGKGNKRPCWIIDCGNGAKLPKGGGSNRNNDTGLTKGGKGGKDSSMVAPTPMPTPAPTLSHTPVSTPSPTPVPTDSLTMS